MWKLSLLSINVFSPGLQICLFARNRNMRTNSLYTQDILVLNLTMWHYITPHYAILNYSPLCCTTLHYTKLYYITPLYASLQYTTLCYTTLHHTNIHYPKQFYFRKGYTASWYQRCLRHFWNVANYSVNQLLTKKNICLMMIEHIETNQIVLYMPGDIWCTYKPPAMCHMSHVRCHTLLFNLSQTVKARDLQFWHNIHYTLWVQFLMSGVTCQVSRVTYHWSCVMCHLLCVICNIYLFLQSGWVGWLRLCYQQGLPCLVFRCFSY